MHRIDDRAARMAQNFEEMNTTARPRYWDDLPLWARVILAASAGVSLVIVALLAAMFISHLMTVAIANAMQPFAGSPF